MHSSHRRGGWLAAALAFATVCSFGTARAQTQVQTLVFASYDNENGAKDAFQAMKQTQKEGVIRIDSYAVVSKDQKGRVRVQSTQRRGALAGSVIGALVGLLGGPAGVAVGATAGGGLGYLTGSTVGIPREDINAIKANLQPGTSAIVAVIDERWVADLERSLHEAQAKQVLDRKIAGTGGAEQAPDTGANPPSTNPSPSMDSPSTTPPSTNPPMNQ
jgi:uncharacterized membrane protein